MHVDGFRFDLAAALARDAHRVSKLAAFFETVHQHPIISQVKLIAEPWDVGEGGYQVGNFPVLWAQWNGRYRDSIRRFWKSDDGLVGEIAYRLGGSSDLYQTTGKRPYASINTSEDDGFLDAPKFFASSSPFDLGPRSLGVFGLHEGTDAQARADAWQTAEAAT